MTKIAYKPGDLPPTTIELTREALLANFTEEQLVASTYTNNNGTFIRLVNSRNTSTVPALYPYEKSTVIHFQQHYSNVSAFKVDTYSTRKLDLLIPSTTVLPTLLIADGE